jgi:holliday junction DNA helicase RuvA
MTRPADFTAALITASANAVWALANLGFKPGVAQSVVALAVEELGGDASLDALVRLALKRASR